MDDRKLKLVDILEDLSTSDILSLWNDYCERSSYTDDYIMDRFEMKLYLEGVSDILRAISEFVDGKDLYTNTKGASPNRSYFTFDGYGDVLSSNDPVDFMNFSDLADYILRNDEDFGNQDIREFLDEDSSVE